MTGNHDRGTPTEASETAMEGPPGGTPRPRSGVAYRHGATPFQTCGSHGEPPPDRYFRSEASAPRSAGKGDPAGGAGTQEA